MEKKKCEEYDSVVFFDGKRDLMNRSYLRHRLCKRRYLAELEKGDILASPGDEVPYCYYLSKGYIIIYEIINGKRRIFDAYDDGNLIFCNHVMFRRPSAFYYEAREQTMLYSISLDKVKRLLQDDQKFNNAFICQLTRDMLVCQDLLRKTVNYSAGWLVSDFLLLFAGRSAYEKDGILYLSERITQKQMADMLYINRITCLKELHKIEDMGLINMQTGHIGIVDIEGLRKYRDSLLVKESINNHEKKNGQI